MACVIRFTTDRFDPARERPNPVNPIAGEAVLRWLRDGLSGTGWTVSEPDTEDWGWYVSVTDAGATYLVGASGEPEDGVRDVEWVLQVHRQRSFLDRLSGKNKMGPEDPLAARIEQLVRGEPSFRDVDVERGA